jgi:alcohol dehydrogenase class IV
MNKSYVIEYPAKIIFGADTLSVLPEHLPMRSKVLIVVGNHALKNGLHSRIISFLSGFETVTVSGISPEPSLEESDKIIGLGRLEKVTAVLAVGGGSVIDAAKTAAAIIPLKGLTVDYFSGKMKIQTKGLFFVAVPTTAGTGSEITPNSVQTDSVTKIKKSIRHSTMVPDLAIVDPVLTLGASPELTAASGMDAFTHAVESFLSLNRNTVSKILSCKAVEKIYKSLPALMNNLDDLALRSEMAEASMLAAMAFSHSGLGAVHGLAHPVGSLLKTPHGLTCAILLPHILEWNMPDCEADFAVLSSVCGNKRADQFPKTVTELCFSLGLPADFKAYGLKKSDFDFIIKNCRSGSMKSTPRAMSDSDITSLLERLI